MTKLNYDIRKVPPSNNNNKSFDFFFFNSVNDTLWNMFRATCLQQYLAPQMEGGGNIYEVTGLPAWILLLTHVLC